MVGLENDLHSGRHIYPLLDATMKHLHRAGYWNNGRYMPFRHFLCVYMCVVGLLVRIPVIAGAKLASACMNETGQV